MLKRRVLRLLASRVPVWKRRVGGFLVTNMTVDDVKAILAQIEDIKADDEEAHGMEDEMRDQVLSAIAEGRCLDPKALAAEALKSGVIRFSRWCA